MLLFLFCWTDKELNGQSTATREDAVQVEAHKHNHISLINRCLHDPIPIIGNNKQFSESKWRWWKRRKTGIRPHLHNQRKAEMREEEEEDGWGGGRDQWRKRLLSDTVVVSKGRCPGATAATLLRDGADWRLSHPTWANKYTQETAKQWKTDEECYLFQLLTWRSQTMFLLEWL